MLKHRNRKGHKDRDLSAEWVYGLNPVLEAVRSGRMVRAVYVSTGRQDHVMRLREESASKGIPVEAVEPAFFDGRFPKGHQGVAARVSGKAPRDLMDLIAIPEERGEVPLFVIIDCIEDPHNFGAILRSSEAAGVHGVVIQSHRSVSLGPATAKASSGAMEYVPVAMVPNIKNAMRLMKDSGVVLVGTEADGENNLWEADLSVPLAVVVGSEGKGMRRTVRELCDQTVRIPLKGTVNSLNVSVAAGIILFEALRQRLSRDRLSGSQGIPSSPLDNLKANGIY